MSTKEQDQLDWELLPNWIELYIPTTRLQIVEGLLPPSYTRVSGMGYWEGGVEPVEVVTVFNVFPPIRLAKQVARALLQSGEKSALTVTNGQATLWSYAGGHACAPSQEKVARDKVVERLTQWLQDVGDAFRVVIWRDEIEHILEALKRLTELEGWTEHDMVRPPVGVRAHRAAPNSRSLPHDADRNCCG